MTQYYSIRETLEIPEFNATTISIGNYDAKKDARVAFKKRIDQLESDHYKVTFDESGTAATATKDDIKRVVKATRHQDRTDYRE